MSDALCCAVGLMTLTWTYAENALAIMLHTIINNTGPIKGHVEAPLSLKRKLNAFRTALRDVSALKLLQKDGRVLAMRFGHLGKRRNNFTHSAAFNLEEGGFEATIARVQGGNYTIENQRVEVHDAVLLQAEITEFCFDVVDFMTRLDAVFGD